MSDIPETSGPLEPVRPPERDAVVAPEARREIEAALSAFRQWLLESEQYRSAIPIPAQDPEGLGSPVDLHTLLAEWIALKQEFRLEARGGKAAREQLDQAVDEFHQGVDHVGSEVRKFLDPLVRDRDRLRDGFQAKIESQELLWSELILDIREALARSVEASRQANRRLGWRRWFLPRGLFGSLLDGYELALRRVDAALESRGIHPIECQGQPVDVERMRVIGVVRRDDLPPGQVVEVVRRGYVRGDRVIRCAEVRAVATTTFAGQPLPGMDVNAPLSNDPE